MFVVVRSEECSSSVGASCTDEKQSNLHTMSGTFHPYGVCIQTPLLTINISLLRSSDVLAAK